MAKIHKDLFGTYHVDVSEEVSKARRDEQFRRDMSQVGSNFDSEMKKGARDGLIASGVMSIGTVAVVVRAVKNPRFRYKLQAVLHFPFAFLVSWVIFLPIMLKIFGAEGADADDGRSMMTITLVCWGLSAVTSVVWSMVYIRKRTKPKLRRLG